MLWFILKLVLVVIMAILAFLIFKVISIFAKYFRLKKKLNVKGVPSLTDQMTVPILKAFGLEGIELLLDVTTSKGENKNVHPLLYCGGFIDGTPWFLSADADDLRLLVEEKNFRKLPLGYEPFHLIIGQGLVVSSGELWKRQRRLISPLFHFHNLKSMAEIIHHDTVKGMESIRSLKGATTSPFEHFSALTLQIVIDCVFGGSNSGLDVPRLIHDWHSLTGNLSRHFLWTMLFGKDLAPYLPFPSVIKIIRTARDIRSAVRSAIQHKKKLLLEQGDDSESTEGGDADLITSLLKVVDPETGEKMSEDLIVDESITFLFAGHDTTSNALSWCLYFLTKHPEVVEKLRSELYSVFPDFGRVIEGEEEVVPTFDDLKQLQFFKYTLMETMRIRPPVPFVDREANEDCELQGVKIPAGSVVSMMFIGAHHDPRYWKDPFEFRPERFDPSNKDQEPARHAFSYLPFSAGSRNCVGQKFAMLDATLILMHIVHNFDVTSDPNEKVFMHYEGTMTPHGFHVQFHPRDLSGSSSSSTH